jgi:catechol 2,3-dioxygenase-like lactoylglutathione lyase family enzyme
VRGAINTGHAVSWKFKAPANEKSVAILVPSATQSEVKILVYTLDQKPVETIMTAWDIDPGKWEITQGLDTNGDEKMDTVFSTQTISLERSKSIPLTFAPRTTTMITLKLQSPSVPYAQRPDLGIDDGDVRQKGHLIHVRVHSLGSVATPVTTVALVEENRIVASTKVPAIQAPLDLLPKYVDVTLSLPPGIDPHKGSIVLDPEEKLNEVTRINNVARLSKGIPDSTEFPSTDQMVSLEKKPRAEHIAFNVANPVAVARWYCDNLEMKIVRKSPPPATTHFIADSAGNMTLELYNNPKGPIPDYASINPQSMRLAFAVENPKEIRDRLIAAGAKLLNDITTGSTGDQLVTLRDPWGLVIQFVHRVSPMLKPTGLRFEHLALNVTDPQTAANWYVENLGMKILRQGPPPTDTRFVADDGMHMMLELFKDTTAPVVDFGTWSTISIHFAFVVNDVRAFRTGLIEAGAKLAEEVRETNAGDEVLVLRDPRGFPIQFIKRGEILLK